MPVLTKDPTSYTECLRRWNDATKRQRNAGEIKLAPNTVLTSKDGCFAVRFYRTDILTFHPDGRVVFRTGGFRTATTKERLNRYSPVGVWASRKVWYVGGDVFEEGYVYHGRPAMPEIRPEWLTENVRGLMANIDNGEHWRGDLLPLLADALEDAGCDSAELLDALRLPNGDPASVCAFSYLLTA